MYAFLAILSQAIAASTGCNYHVQIAQVQDATQTFTSDIQDMKDNKLIDQLIQSLKSTYSAVDYALATFQDKPGPVTGDYSSAGWWSDRYVPQESHCYELKTPLTSDSQVAASSFDGVKTVGGKDFNENQWDALFRVTQDYQIGWDTRTHDDNGDPIVRIAVLITDDAAHTSENTFKDNPRNANAEWYRQWGPWHSAASIPTQGCDLERSYVKTNNINETWGDFTSGVPQDAYDYSNGGSCMGWGSSRTGLLRSLKGINSYFNYFYGFSDTNDIIAYTECSPNYSDINGEEPACREYAAFLECCTAIGVSDPFSCVADSASYSYFPNVHACMDFGGRFARCHPDQKRADGSSYDVHREGPFFRSQQCTEETPEWRVAQSMEPDERFWHGLERVFPAASIAEIPEYPYGPSLFETDCTNFEYPDPTDPRYVQGFLDRGIIPIIVAAPPSKRISSPGSSMSNYDPAALRMSRHNCPGLEFDPWTTYVCDASINGSNYCYFPDSYPQFYPYPHSDESLWSGSTAWWLNKCEGVECATKWWSECMHVEYGEPIQKMNDQGLLAYYVEMNYDHIAQDITAKIQSAVDMVTADMNCMPPAPLAPELTDTPVITEAPIVTEAPVTEAPIVTEAPVITVAPIITEAPVITEAPIVTEAPVITEAPIVTEAPVITEAPIVTEAPVITEAPIVTEAPVITEAPIVTEAPIGPLPPIVTEAPVMPELIPTETETDTTLSSEDSSDVGLIVGSAMAGVGALGVAALAAAAAKGLIALPSFGSSGAEVFTEDVDLIIDEVEREQMQEVENSMFL